ncbi:hypothetical protein D3C72_749850 [compost metagenome]
MEERGVLVVGVIQISFENQEARQFRAIAESFKKSVQLLSVHTNQLVELRHPQSGRLVSQIADALRGRISKCRRLPFQFFLPL